MKRYYRYARKILLRLLDTWIDQLDDFLAWAQGLREATFRELATFIIYQYRRLVLFLRKGIIFRIYRLRGAAEGTGQPFSVLFVTESHVPEYLQTQFFQDGAVERVLLGKIPFWEIPAVCGAARAEYDLILVERNNLLNWTPASGQWLVAPAWVRMAFEFEKGETWDDRMGKLRSQDRNIRRIKKSEMTYRISKSEQDFDFFYDRMYVPSVENRHGLAGIVNRKEKLREAFRRGMLMFAQTAEGEDIGGKLAVVSGDLYFGVSNGVLDGQAEHREAGAISAMYYFSILWAYEQKLRRYDIGEVRPFLDDGVYLHKKRWGFEPVPDLWVIREWLFWIPNESRAAVEWMHRHPFLPGFSRGNIGVDERLMLEGNV